MNHGPTTRRAGTDVQRLHELLVAACEGQRPPCRGRTEWTSEDTADRVAAVEGCSHCLHRAKCAAYARAAGERFGVWAGRDRTTSASTARRRAQTEPRSQERTTP